MLVFHLPISRFLSYGITPRPMAGPVGRQVTAPGISELLHTWGPSAPSPSGGRSHTRSVELRRDSKISGFLLAIAVGTPITGRPPHRTVRAAFLHTAPTSDV